MTLVLVAAGVAVCAQPLPELQTQLAEIRRLVDAGDFKRADELATALVRQNAASYEAYEALGRVKDAARRFEEADVAYHRAIQLAPNAASPHVSLGVSYVQRGQTSLALGQFREALVQDPRNLAALSNAGSLELGTNHFAEAEDYYWRAQGIAPDDPVILLGLATAAFSSGHRELAQKSVAILARSEVPSVRFSLGLLLAKNGLLAEAAEQFETLAQKGPGPPELFVNLGLVYSELHKYDAAKANYFRAINLNPGNPLPYVRVGSDYLDQKKSNLAIVWLFRAVKLDHGQPDTLYLLGRALLEAEYFETAHTYLSQYVRLRSGDPKGWLLLGDAFLNDEQLEKALESYQKALALVPQLGTAHYLVGNAQYLLKRIPEAKREFLAALRLSPSHFEAQLRLAEIAYQEGDDADASSRLRSILSVRPGDLEATYDLAKVYVRQNQYGQARNLLESLVVKRPDDMRFHYLLSQVYKQLNADDQSAKQAALYRAIKSEQDYQHRFIRHSHAYVE